MDSSEMRGAFDRCWAASDASEFAAEHEIYRWMRCWIIRNRVNACATDTPSRSRAAPSRTASVAVRRILGAGDLWIIEFVITYEGFLCDERHGIPGWWHMRDHLSLNWKIKNISRPSNLHDHQQRWQFDNQKIFTNCCQAKENR